MRDPFKIDGPTCISFSGGRTSAYMLWRVLQSNGGLPPEAKVCFANTGKEEEATLEFVLDCATAWEVPIVWLEYSPSDPGFTVVSFDTASRNGEPFAALIEKKNYLPNPVTRFCTQELKVLTIERYLKSIGFGDADTMVGVRADESRRLPKIRSRGLLVPLADANVSQAQVMDFWRHQIFDLGLDFINGVTPKGNCDLCFLKGGSQIFSLIKHEPKRAVWWVNMEQKINATFRSDRPSYAQMAKYAEQQMDMFSEDEGIPCFCGD